MTVHHFYLFITLLLAAIYLLFKPMDVQLNDSEEVAQLELENFQLFELNTQRLKTVLSGSEGKRFSDRYEVYDVNYTNNTEESIENMVASYGLYKGETLALENDVHYRRDDGVNFTCNKAEYNKVTSVIQTVGPFTLWQYENRFSGTDLLYYSKQGKVSADDVTGIYTITEKDTR